MAQFNFKQCKFCEKLFQSFGGSICHNCLEQIDEDFVAIRDYLYDQPGNIGVEAIHEGTQVPRNIILHLIKEKRLTISDPSTSSVTCEVCKRPISSGTMCQACMKTLFNKLQSTLPEPPEAKQKKTMESKKPRMHTDHLRK